MTNHESPSHTNTSRTAARTDTKRPPAETNELEETVNKFADGLTRKLEELQKQIEALEAINFNFDTLFYDVRKNLPYGSKLGFFVCVNSDGSFRQECDLATRVPVEAGEKRGRQTNGGGPGNLGYDPGLDGIVYGFAPPSEDPLATARERGREAASRLQKMQGGAWTGAQLKERFDLSSATLHRRRADHRIVFWQDAKHVFYYPQWQFTNTGAVLPDLKAVLTIFQSNDGWRLTQYFLTPRQQLDNQSPLTLINHGQLERVIAHAKLNSEEDTW